MIERNLDHALTLVGDCLEAYMQAPGVADEVEARSRDRQGGDVLKETSL